MLILPNLTNFSAIKNHNNKNKKSFPQIKADINIPKDVFIRTTSSNISFTGSSEYDKRLQNIVDTLSKRNERSALYKPKYFFEVLSQENEINKLKLSWLEEMVEQYPNKNIEFLQEVVKTEEQFIGRINNLEKKRES